jgi:hypothetical protein
VIEVTAPNAASVLATITLTEREVNKATARGINRATAAGRAAVQSHLPVAFPGAKPRALAWMRLMVRFDRQSSATPDKLEARVTVGAPSYYLRAPWMLLPTFEDGGTQRGRDNIPTLGWRVPVKPQGSDTRAGLKPKTLGLAYRQDPGGALYLATGRGALGGNRRGNTPRTARGRVFGNRKTFVVQTTSGVWAIMQRTGKGDGGTVRALWWLRPHQVVPKRPWFNRTAERATQAALPTMLAEEMRKQVAWAWERRGMLG